MRKRMEEREKRREERQAKREAERKKRQEARQAAGKKTGPLEVNNETQVIVNGQVIPINPGSTDVTVTTDTVKPA